MTETRVPWLDGASGALAAWCVLTVLMTGLLLCLPVTEEAPLRRCWVLRLLRGDLGPAGTLGVGLCLAGLLLWLAAAGWLTDPDAQLALALMTGAGVLTGLFNAGRRTALSGTGALALGAALAAGLLGLLWLAVALATGGGE
ncbi:hypothetical protein FOT62_25060 [Serratia marcescens]|uniref:Uncharacterized protein n=4 Tax=Serratia marcescens TaxID=615 RepID=A0A5C7BLJ1_SERMA|nr:hypothetical protein [Serratia marcescens]TXE23936.1 hypothetical protein FOT62_25060 [Serratia marcescens]